MFSKVKWLRQPSWIGLAPLYYHFLNVSLKLVPTFFFFFFFNLLTPNSYCQHFEQSVRICCFFLCVCVLDHFSVQFGPTRQSCHVHSHHFRSSCFVHLVSGVSSFCQFRINWLLSLEIRSRLVSVSFSILVS